MPSKAEEAFAVKAISLGRVMAERGGQPPARKTPERYFYSRIRAAAERRNDNAFTLAYRHLLDEHAPGWDVGLEWDEEDQTLARLIREDPERVFAQHAREIGEAKREGTKLTTFQHRFLSSVRESARGSDVGRRFDTARRTVMDTHVPGWDHGLVWEAADRARSADPRETFQSRAEALGRALRADGRAGVNRTDKAFLTAVRSAALGNATNRRFDLTRRQIMDASAPGWDEGLTFASPTAIRAERTPRT